MSIIAIKKTPHANKVLTAVSTAILLGAGLSMSAQAAPGFANNTGLNTSCFSYPAVAMTPYNEDLSKYAATSSGVKHKTNLIGRILLYGPVQPWNMSGDHVFSASFKDPDGAGNDSQVTAELRFVDANGIKIIKVLKSNDFAQAVPGKQTMSAGLTRRDIGYVNGHYIVRIYIQRNALIKPVAYGYNLCSTVG